MIQLVLIFAIVNVLLGYALAVTLADPPLGGFSPWKAWQDAKIWPLALSRIIPGAPAAVPDETESIESPREGIAISLDERLAESLAEVPQPAGPPLPPIALPDELPAAWGDLLAGEQIAPQWFADGLAHGLRLHLAAYRQHALAAEARARLVLSQECPEAVEQLVADFRFLHHEWLSRLLEGAELLHQRRGRLGAAEEAGGRLESLLYDHAARMETIDRGISEINFKTDVVLGCRRLLEELLDLAAGVHLLRDDLTESLTAILSQQEMLGELAHEQRLDPLTGRLNRIGLEAAFREPSGLRQALLIAWDRFRQVNERLGTRAGDRTLRAFSQLLTDLLQTARISAEIVRLTGTRFLLLLDGVTPEQAINLAEQLRQSLEGVTFDWQGASLEMSARLGISTVEGGETLEALLARLDQAVDAAELAGRNRCAVAAAGEIRIVAPQPVPVIARRVTIGDAL